MNKEQGTGPINFKVVDIIPWTDISISHPHLGQPAPEPKPSKK